jgi:hypothetical protein
MILWVEKGQTTSQKTPVLLTGLNNMRKEERKKITQKSSAWEAFQRLIHCLHSTITIRRRQILPFRQIECLLVSDTQEVN